jgi:hypothetical protein
MTRWAGSEKLPIHPMALLVPPPTDDEQHRLNADVGKHGIKVPVVLFVVGPGIKGTPAATYLGDGISRLTALVESGLEVLDERGHLHPAIPRIEMKIKPDTDVLALVLSLNAHRRHLTREQREQLIEARIKANPEKSDRQIAKEIDASHDKVRRVRKKVEGRDATASRRTVVDTKGRAQPVKKAKPLPPIERFNAKMIEALHRPPTEEMKTKLDELEANREHMPPIERRALALAARGAATRLSAFADRVDVADDALPDSYRRRLARNRGEAVPPAVDAPAEPKSNSGDATHAEPQP